MFGSGRGKDAYILCYFQNFQSMNQQLVAGANEISISN